MGGYPDLSALIEENISTEFSDNLLWIFTGSILLLGLLQFVISGVQCFLYFLTGGQIGEVDFFLEGAFLDQVLRLFQIVGRAE